MYKLGTYVIYICMHINGDMLIKAENSETKSLHN